MLNTRLNAYKTWLFGTAMFAFAIIFSSPALISNHAEIDLYRTSTKVPGDFISLNEALAHATPGENIWITDESVIEYPIVITQKGITVYCGEGIKLTMQEEGFMFDMLVQELPNHRCKIDTSLAPYRYRTKLELHK